jgi:hypothetical protein
MARSDNASIGASLWLIMSTMTRGKVDIVNGKAFHTSDEIFDLIHTIMHLFRSQQYRGLPNGSHDHYTQLGETADT